jgi:cytochrome c oxidase assembly protein subunit 15
METPYHRGLHRFAVFTACSTFVLLIAGALVTSNDAGLSVPDWPLSYGSLAPPMVGGIFYEHGHRMVATFVGVLTIVLAIWLWKRERRSWVRRLGMVALGAVVAQGVLGGLTVLFYLPVAISVGHACLGQIFFSIVGGIALFTSRWWLEERPQMEDSGSPTVRRLGMWTVAAVFVQLMLGAAFRHRGFGIVPHLVGAGVVTVLMFVLGGALKRRFAKEAMLRRCRRLLHGLIGLQLVLGGAAWWSRWFAKDFPQPIPVMVALTVGHTVVGALVLASAVGVTLVCWRVVRQGRELALERGVQNVQHPAAL